MAAKKKESGVGGKGASKGASKGVSRDTSKDTSIESPKTTAKRGKGAHKNAERKEDSLSTEVIGEKEESKKTEDDFMDDGRCEHVA